MSKQGDCRNCLWIVTSSRPEYGRIHGCSKLYDPYNWKAMKLSEYRVNNPIYCKNYSPVVADWGEGDTVLPIPL